MKPGRSRTPRGQSDVFWTPRDIIADLEQRNGAPYAVDFAADARSAVAPRWYGQAMEFGVPGSAQGSLVVDWAAVINETARGPGWCNPPYSKPNLPAFTEKAWLAAPRLKHPLDLLVPVSPRAGWFRGVWAGQVEGYHAINHGPLRGQVLRLRCEGYRKELVFFGYSLAFLDNGEPTDSGLGSHVLIRLRAA